MSSFLFRLDFDLAGKPCTIKAYDGGFRLPNHNRIDVEVEHGGVVVFPRGATWCATPGSVDGTDARELVLSLVAMKPGDTDPDYFDGYTPDQLTWATAHGEAVDMVKHDRYYDDQGDRLDSEACPGFDAEHDEAGELGDHCQVCGAHSDEHTDESEA